MALLLGAVLGVALLAEAALWIIWPVQDPFASRGRDSQNPYVRMEYPRNYEVDTEVAEVLPGISGKNRFTTNEMGFRGDRFVHPKPTGEKRIFVLGGSTVECFYLDDKDQLGAAMQRRLKRDAPDARVYNVGFSGAASDDHIAIIAQRLVHLDPDVIVVMCGFNDLMRSINGADPLHFADPLDIGMFHRALSRSQLGRRLVYFKRKVWASPAQIQSERTLRSSYQRLFALQQSAPDSDERPAVDIDTYRDNLLTMAGIARSHEFRLVFVTHPSTWDGRVDEEMSAHHWMRYHDGVTYSEDVMAAALDAHNRTMLRVAAELEIPALDLAAMLPKSTEYFYDDCHFTPTGAKAAGDRLATFFIDSGIVARKQVSPTP